MKNESKYFNTALKMDKAFLEILEDAAKGQRQTEGESHEP